MASVEGVGGGWAATCSATDEDDDDRSSPGVVHTTPPDPGVDCERSGLIKRKMLADAAYYEDLLSQKRRKAMQSTLDSWFKKKKPSSSEVPTSDKPEVIKEPLTSDEPQPSTSTGGYTPPNDPSSQLPSSSSLSDVDDPDVI